jgi:DNA-binding response OmpR family regulator
MTDEEQAYRHAGGIAGIVIRRQWPLKRQDLGSGLCRAEQSGSCPVFFVSSDQAFAGEIEEQLKRSGYSFQSVPSVSELLKAVPLRPPALILVDRRIGDWDVLRTEAALSHVPILTLIPQGSAASDADVIADLERGADGAYACRDGHRLFLAVIGAYLRRAGYGTARRGVYQLGGLELDADMHEVKIAGQPIQLSAKPFAILQVFISAPSKVFTRGELIDRGWGPGFAIGKHALDAHIHTIRRQLERAPGCLCRLVSIKGVGFKLKLLQPSIPVSLGAEGPAAATALPIRWSGAAHVPIAQPPSIPLPMRNRRASLRRISRRRRGPSELSGRFEFVNVWSRDR